MKPSYLALWWILAAAPLQAELTLPRFFSDGLVLQRDREAAIWGRADAGSEVTVSFKGRSVRAKADGEGRWRTTIASGAADAAGAVLSVAAGSDTVEIHDVLVGEVWFASGQSNMVYTMNRNPDYAALIAESTHPALRFFNAAQTTAVEPQEDIDGEWTSATPETVPGYSAVAFFYARKLHLELGVPVAVIKSAWGGKPVETFTSREALGTLPGTRALVEVLLAEDAAHDPDKARIAHEVRLAKWFIDAKAWRAKPVESRGKLAKKPTEPKRPLDTEGRAGVLYNGMIHPFVGYTMRGAIWYQGEGNAKVGAVPYDETLPLLIRDWRGRWGDEFSFYFVQLANFREPSTEPGQADPWALLQDRMRRVLATTPKTGMAIINDTGEVGDIHPKNKQDPGERLARWALARDYGQKLVAVSGPLYRDATIEGGAIRVTFDEAGAGLRSRDGGPLQRFEIAGEDRVWKWAEARIDGPDSVLVSAAGIPAPVAVRFAWASNPEGANLINSEGLPASVFRSDDWPDAETLPVNPAADLLKERRALAMKLRALHAKRDALDRGSEAWRAVAGEIKVLSTRLKAMKPAPVAAPAD